MATETALKSIRKTKKFLFYMSMLTFLACGVAFLEMGGVILELLDLIDEGTAPVIAYFRILAILVILVIAMITFIQGMHLLKSSRSAGEATTACLSTVIERVMLYQFKFWRMTVIALGIAVIYAIIVEQTDSAIKKAKHIKKWEIFWEKNV